MLSVISAAAVVTGACGGGDEAETTTVQTPTSSATVSSPVAPTSSGAEGPCGVAGAEPVEFPAGRDNATMRGFVAGTGPVGVVLAHQARVDSCDWAFYVPTLVEAGVTVLAFDFTGDGESDDTEDDRLELDVLAAVGELESRGVEDVVVIGASKGATAAIAAGAADGSGIDGVVSLSAVASYQDTDAVRAAGSLAVPTLLVVAEDDGGPAEDAVEIEEACACENLELLTVPSSRHGVELLRSTDAGAGEINRQVLEFLAGIG